MINVDVTVTASGEINVNVPGQLKIVSQKAAEKVHDLLLKHFAGLKSGPGFYAQAAKETEVNNSPGDADAAVEIRKPGVRLQWQGGTVKATGRESAVTGNPIQRLLIPMSWSPLKGKALSDLALDKDRIKVIPRKTKAPLLVYEPEPQYTKRGKLTQASRRQSRLMVLGILLKSVTIKAHPNVMPTTDEFKTAARAGAQQQLQRILRYEKE